MDKPQDIVERLRRLSLAYGERQYEPGSLMAAAADEIERLRAALRSEGQAEPVADYVSVEQRIRDALERMEIPNAQSYSAGELVELSNLVRGIAPDEDTVRDAERLFAAIAHGDDVHRAWLREALHAYFAGEPIPAPRSSAHPSEATVRDAVDLVIALTDAFERFRFPEFTGAPSKAEQEALNERALAWIRKHIPEFDDAARHADGQAEGRT